MRVRIFPDWSEARDLWPRLADLGHAVTGHPFQTREWIDAWAATLGRAAEAAPLFAMVEQDGAPLAYCPLFVRRRSGVRCLEGLTGDVSDYQAPLVAAGATFDGAAADALWRALGRGPVPFDLLLLERAPETLSGQPNPFLAWGARPHRGAGHQAALTGDWPTWFAARFGAETRATLRRKRRKLAALGPLEARFANGVPEALDWLDRLVALKAERMAETGRGAENTLAAPETVAFFRALTRLDPAQAHIRVFALLVDARPVALQWGAEAGGRFANMLISHAGGDWKRFSPGLLMTEDLFAWCFSRGIRAFDFGLGDEAYKDRWCEETIPLHTVMRARTLKGQGLLLARSARAGLRTSRTLRAVRNLLRAASRR